MRTTRLYDPQPLSLNQEIILSPFAAKHIVQVLRARVGDPVIIFNGVGGQYRGTISEIQKQKVAVTLTTFEEVTVESALSVQLIQAVSRSEHMDYTLQKATELGVTHVSPVTTMHSAVKLDENRSSKRHAHWQNILVSSSEQSGRTVLPILDPATSLEKMLASLPPIEKNELRLIAHPTGGEFLNTYAAHWLSQELACVRILIGAEGGFVDNEVVLAQQFDFQVLSLGPRILRTETAAVTALSLLQYVWGDF